MSAFDGLSARARRHRPTDAAVARPAPWDQLGSPPPTRRSVLGGAVALGGTALLSPFTPGRTGPAVRAAAAAPVGFAPARAEAVDRLLVAAPQLAAHPSDSVRYGVNYTPSKNWWFSWQHWDRGSVDHDLRQIAGLGLDHIRIQLLWSVFQPSPHSVAKAPLDHLEELLDLAGSHGLDVTVSVLTGNLSGLSFLPAWAGNYVTNRATVAAEEVFFRAVGNRIGRHRALMGFDLGNELLGNAPPCPEPVLRAWVKRLLHVCDLVAPDKLHSVSPRGNESVPYPELVGSLGGVSVIHPWVFDAGSARGQRLNPLAINQATFNAELVKSFHDYSHPGVVRQVWVQEFGAPEVNFARLRVLPPPLHAEFLTRTCAALLNRGDLFGITWWCSHDLPSSLSAGFREPERHLGLFDSRGRPKATAGALAAVAAGGSLPAPSAVPVPREAVGRSDRNGFERVLRSHRLPVIVPDDRFHDQAYLRLRGVTS